MGSRIVVFDGDCGLCNGFVAWLLTHDPHGAHLITGGASEVGASIVSRAGLDPLVTDSTMILWVDGEALVRSDAVLEVLGALPVPWSLLRAGRLVPRALRDRIYDAMAARRPRIDGDDACGVPPEPMVDLWRSRLATPADL
ncbi:thiol-disulfide oxidoreductase DCC family protein [Demequina salsinemoris]|uniref:thiol-disulfide oxidoreductase DCC family protein n=1 Tax=Demequina salsinemoris TaxID=577470 RepID=UPI000783201B|nr:DCC1-like thiol-disulfide oxidoreductase family protein [Demequina salsinemoris]